MSKQQLKEWMATNDHISYICADSCYAWYLSHVMWRVNPIDGPAQLHFPSHFFLSNAFMASARSFNMFKSMLQLGLID